MLNRIILGAYSLLRREDGPTAVEYAVMLALILMVVFAAVAQIGGYTSDMYNDLSLQGVKVKVP